MKKLIGIHLAGNALLLWLAYEWLSVDETSTARLLLSAIDALAIVALACWLHGGTIVFFAARKDRRIDEALRVALRNVGWLVLVAILGIVVYGAMGAVASTPVAVWVVRVVRWGVLPPLFLPVLGGLATKGRRGWRAVLVRPTLRRAVVTVVLLLAGLWLPLLILGWSPRPGGFGLEMASFVLRATVAYLLFVGGTIALAHEAASSPA